MVHNLINPQFLENIKETKKNLEEKLKKIFEPDHEKLLYNYFYPIGYREIKYLDLNSLIKLKT